MADFQLVYIIILKFSDNRRTEQMWCLLWGCWWRSAQKVGRSFAVSLWIKRKHRTGCQERNCDTAWGSREWQTRESGAGHPMKTVRQWWAVHEQWQISSNETTDFGCTREVKKKVQAEWRRVSGAICDRKRAARVKGRFYRIGSYCEFFFFFSGLDLNHFVDYILMRWWNGKG